MDYKVYLVKKARRGDVEAFTELYRTVYKRLYQYALYTLGNPQDAEDVVSDAVVDAFEGIKKLKKPEAFDTWFFRILQAKCNRKLRDIIAARNVIDFDSYLENNHPASDAEISELSRVVESMYLQDAFSILDATEHEIINLHIILGYTTSEIATLLHLKESTVRSKESRALKKIRANVREEVI